MHRVQHFEFVTNFLWWFGLSSTLLSALIVIITVIILDGVFTNPSEHNVGDTAGGLLVGFILFLVFTSLSVMSFLAYSFIGP